MKITRQLATVLGFSALFFAAPALAATGGPAIAYSIQNGSTFSIYLTNPDGSGTVKLYTAPVKTNIAQIDMRPGGNQLAIIEGSAGRNLLKIIAYTDAGNPTSIATVDMSGCTATGIDYHPSGDGSMIVARYCGSAQNLEVRRFTNGAFESSPIVTLGTGVDSAMGPIRWLGDGSGFLLAYDTITGGVRIQRHELSNPNAPVTVWSMPNPSNLPNWFDVARCSGALDSTCAKFLYTDGSGNLHQVHFDDFGGTDEGVLMAGADGHYSPDNSQILYRVSNKTNQQLKIDSTTLVSKGTFAGKDWRP
jgi:hypothetical protein